MHLQQGSALVPPASGKFGYDRVPRMPHPAVSVTDSLGGVAAAQGFSFYTNATQYEKPPNQSEVDGEASGAVTVCSAFCPSLQAGHISIAGVAADHSLTAVINWPCCSLLQNPPPGGPTTDWCQKASLAGLAAIWMCGLQAAHGSFAPCLWVRFTPMPDCRSAPTFWTSSAQLSRAASAACPRQVPCARGQECCQGPRTAHRHTPLLCMHQQPAFEPFVPVILHAAVVRPHRHNSSRHMCVGS